MSAIAIVGGTGLEQLPDEFSVEPLTIETRFGVATAAVARSEDQEFVFLSRHGAAHGIPPHRVNYRANIAALVELGVTRVLATNAVGSLRLSLVPGALILLSDFIDFTRGRGASYWDDAVNSPAAVVHTDFSEPYCPEMRGAVLRAATKLGADLTPRGVYLCAEGPRYESPAEIKMFAQWGADVVGMTGLPEAVFAREAGLCYAAIAIVTNYAAGITKQPIAHGDVTKKMAETITLVRSLLLTAAQFVPAGRHCHCGGTPTGQNPSAG